MSLAHSAAQYMLSDSLIPEGSGDSRLKALALELPLDRIIKFVSVGLPLLLVSMAFAREISFGECAGNTPNHGSNVCALQSLVLAGYGRRLEDHYNCG